LAEQLITFESSGLSVPCGHPLHLLHLENQAILERISQAEEELDEHAGIDTLREHILQFQQVRKHYAKKELLLFPLMEDQGSSAIPGVMWELDDDILDSLYELSETITRTNADDKSGELYETLGQMRGMVFKEEEVLFPLVYESIPREDWLSVYADLPEIGFCFLTEIPEWEEGEQWADPREDLLLSNELSDAIVSLPNGNLTFCQLFHIFESLPVDLAFVDQEYILRFFSRGNELVWRPASCLGRSVLRCHSPKKAPVITEHLEALRSGSIPFEEITIEGRSGPVTAQHLPICNNSGDFLGVLEILRAP